ALYLPKVVIQTKLRRLGKPPSSPSSSSLAIPIPAISYYGRSLKFYARFAPTKRLVSPLTPSELSYIYIIPRAVPAASAAVPYSTFNSLRLGRSTQSIVGRLIRF
ncbi:hypothetical protein IGI04_007279, partial [Brassica rapa subsp. trilocularis]